MSRDRQGSDLASSVEQPVIFIHRKSNESEDSSIRKSVSFSSIEKDKPLPNEPPLKEGYSSRFSDDDIIVFTGECFVFVANLYY
jgi:hypothetical protein